MFPGQGRPVGKGRAEMVVFQPHAALGENAAADNEGRIRQWTGPGQQGKGELLFTCQQVVAMAVRMVVARLHQAQTRTDFGLATAAQPRRVDVHGRGVIHQGQIRPAHAAGHRAITDQIHAVGRTRPQRCQHDQSHHQPAQPPAGGARPCWHAQKRHFTPSVRKCRPAVACRHIQNRTTGHNPLWSGLPYNVSPAHPFYCEI